MKIYHGLCKTREYKAWKSLRSRCRSNNPITYPHYKAKGITVCPRWDSFLSFLSDMGQAPSPSHEIDRINNDGNYEPSNCRWVTSVEQSANRSISKRWIIGGIEYESLAFASEAHGVSVQTIKNWCEGQKSKRGGKLPPKQNCRSYKPYENITTPARIR